MEDWMEVGLALLAWLLITCLAFPIWLAQRLNRLLRPKPAK
jgi:hypothetical protein